MKIIEAMKKIKTIDKKILKNNVLITKYASMLDNQKPYFTTEEEQKKELLSLIQANRDLMKEALHLKKCIDKTNMITMIKIDKEEYSLVDLLNIRRKYAKYMMDTYNSLNENNANSSLRINNVPTVKISRLYDENMKNKGINYWQELYDNIDSRLEVVNATTDLIE